MPNSADFGEVLEMPHAAFSQSIDSCLTLYQTAAASWIQGLSAEAAAREAAATRRLMDDLARGLLMKIFLTIVRADRRFSHEERELAQVLILKLWGRSFMPDEVGPVLVELLPMADSYTWYQLVRPFDEVPALRERVSEIETIAMRFGNLVAKVDGTISPEEAVQLKGLLGEISRHLRPVPIENQDLASAPNAQAIRRSLNSIPALGDSTGATNQAMADHPPTNEQRLQVAMESLDALVGLESIKDEVRELARFLRVQQRREEAGLPRTQVTLHTVFTGNPGTGKTSVARILGEVFGALGIVKQGHLIEADRSSLVAGYMGQTAERTNKIVDRALDGVLFIDEAYSLISDEGEDPYGHEAMQILLKRMEDNRDRLVVVLAGYPDEMERLLASNPGLASRFQRTFAFPDYSVVELCRIFQMLCDKNHYVLPAATRARLLVGFRHLLAERTEHFGNGRLVRNAFELSIRRLASRVADVAPLTKELLTQIEPVDVRMADVPESIVDAELCRTLSVNIVCSGCKQVSTLPAEHLGRRVQCNRCRLQFTADWGRIAALSASETPGCESTCLTPSGNSLSQWG